MELTRIKAMLVPVAWVLVGVQVLVLLAQVWWFIQPVSGPGSSGSGAAGYGWVSALVALVIGLAVGWAGSGPAVRPVLIAALVVTGASLLVALVTGVLVLVPGIGAVPPGDLVTHLLGLVVSLAVPAVVLVVLRGFLAPTRTAAAPAPAPVPAALPAPTDMPPATGTAPVWQPDRAAGVHWHTAGAAAAGAAAAEWGTSGQGWTPSARRAVGQGGMDGIEQGGTPSPQGPDHPPHD